MKKIARYLVTYELWLVAIPMAASLVSAQFLTIAVLTAGFFFVLRFLAYGRFTIHTDSNFPIILLSALLPLTLWVTAFPEITTIQVYRLLAGIGIFFTIINWTWSTNRLNLVINGVIGMGLVLSILAPIAVDWTNKLSFIPAQIYQPFKLVLEDTIHPNVMAGALVLIIPVAIGWLLFAWQDLAILEKLLACLSSLAMFAVLFLTQSRGAWLALFIVLIFFPLLRWRWGWIFSVLGLLSIFAAVYLIGPTRVFTALFSGGSIRGVASRIEIWERAYFMIRDFAFTGVGMGSFTQVADKIYPFTVASPGTIFHAHNLFLQIGVDLGIPGLIFWLSIFIINLYQSMKSYLIGKNKKDLRLTAASIAVLGSNLSLAIHGMTDSVVWGMVRTAPLVWIIWGISSSVYLHLQLKYKNPIIDV